MNSYNTSVVYQFHTLAVSAKPEITPPAKREIIANNGKRVDNLSEWISPALFSAYSRAFFACLNGKRHSGRGLNIARLNRALMLIVTGQAAAKIAHYHTTVSACRCEDFGQGAFICKHQLAVMLLKRAGEVR